MHNAAPKWSVDMLFEISYEDSEGRLFLDYVDGIEAAADMAHGLRLAGFIECAVYLPQVVGTGDCVYHTLPVCSRYPWIAEGKAVAL